MEPKLPNDELSLFNICKGSVPEIFARELGKVFENIGDVNTKVSKPRTISLQFNFTPYPDRSGAMVSLECKSTLGALDASDVIGTVFLVKHDGKVSAYSRDVRQELLFGKEEKDTNIIPMSGKDASAGA